MQFIEAYVFHHIKCSLNGEERTKKIEIPADAIDVSIHSPAKYMDGSFKKRFDTKVVQPIGLSSNTAEVFCAFSDALPNHNKLTHEQPAHEKDEEFGARVHTQSIAFA